MSMTVNDKAAAPASWTAHVNYNIGTCLADQCV